MKNWEYEYKSRETSEEEGVVERGDFIIIFHPVVANLFLNRIVHIKIKRSGAEGEVLCTPAILKAFTLGNLEYFKVHKAEVDHLVGWKCDNDEFALHVLQYGLEQNERDKFFDWYKWSWRSKR